jgi:DNA-binding protein H-NS
VTRAGVEWDARPALPPVTLRGHKVISMATYKELRQQAERLSRQADEALDAARKDSLAQVLSAIKEFGFTAEELGLSKRAFKSEKSKKAKGERSAFTRAAKYRDPVSGITWTGAGRQPKWIVGDKDKYLIMKKDEQE